MADLTTVALETEFTRTTLRELLEASPGVCASIYVPTFRSPPETKQNFPRLRNLLREAHTSLKTLAENDDAAKSLAADVEHFSKQVNAEFLAGPLDGVVLFFSPDSARAFKLAAAFDERVAVGEQFVVSPLLDYLQGDGRYFVLAVSRKEVRLLEGNKRRLEKLELNELPKDLEEALNIDEYVRSTQFHTESPGGRAGIDSGGGIFHGHGGWDQGDKKNELALFFQRIDAALKARFTDESVPLLFAGVEYLFPIFQEAVHYRGLVDQPITGNPEGWNEQTLHEKAWPVVQARFDANRKTAIEQFGSLRAAGQASDQLDEALEAALAGRVGTLLVARRSITSSLGSMVATDDASKAVDRSSAAADNPIENAAAYTLINSGAVYMADDDEMPTPSPVAALYRY
jgi:hypothetical protein